MSATASACGEVETGHPPAEGTLSFLAYNVHGLPPEITGDDTAGRMELIAPLLVDFDIVGLQEDFDDDNHELLVAEADHETLRRFADLYVDERVYGSGLSVLARATELDYLHEHFTDCSGVLDGASDCLASKGFQAVRLEVAPGAVVDIYNSHLEAGGGEGDELARAAHVDQLIAAMNGWSEGRSVVFLGDTNLHAEDEPDGSELDRWLSSTGLTDACTAVGCEEPNHIDRIFFRHGGGVSWTAESWANEPRFTGEDGVGYSDHPAISAQLAWVFEGEAQ